MPRTDGPAAFCTWRAPGRAAPARPADARGAGLPPPAAQKGTSRKARQAALPGTQAPLHARDERCAAPPPAQRSPLRGAHPCAALTPARRPAQAAACPKADVK